QAPATNAALDQHRARAAAADRDRLRRAGQAAHLDRHRRVGVAAVAENPLRPRLVAPAANSSAGDDRARVEAAEGDRAHALAEPGDERRHRAVAFLPVAELAVAAEAPTADGSAGRHQYTGEVVAGLKLLHALAEPDHVDRRVEHPGLAPVSERALVRVPPALD